MLFEFLTIITGILFILVLGEVVIRNAIELARYFRLSGTFIGLSVLSIGTSIPEIMTHVVGSVNILRQPDAMHAVSSLLIGANIGSDIFQQNFVLPLIGILGTIVVLRRQLVLEVGALAGASFLVWVLCLDGLLDRLEGAILIFAYAAYLLILAKNDHPTEAETDPHSYPKWRVNIAILVILLSFTIMAVVTDRVVDSAIRLVSLLPISASFFGVLILGIATALPELTTSLISIYKGQKDISAGILIGSNITNPLLALGAGAVISRYSVAQVFVLYDLPIKIATAMLLYIFLLRREDLNNREAMVLLALYLVYAYLRQLYFPADKVF